MFKLLPGTEREKMIINAFSLFWLPHQFPFGVPTSSLFTFIFSSALDAPFFIQILCSYTRVSLKTLCDVPMHAPFSCFTYTPLFPVLFPRLVSLALPLPLLFVLVFILPWQTNSPSFPRNPGRPDSTFISPFSFTANQELNPYGGLQSSSAAWKE